MKWYETPIEDLYERALSALARNDEDTYKENLIHADTLIRQRKFQTIGIQGRARLMDYYQGLDALLRMEQSKLRILACRAADEDGRFERYTSEMCRCNQVICRIQRERTRRIVAEVYAKLRE